MKTNLFSPDTNSKKSLASTDLSPNKSGVPLTPEAVARRAYAIYEDQGSQPGHEVNHWLEAEAQLFGGVERESQMRPGTSLFTVEH